MKKERQIEILMADRCTRKEAEKYLNYNSPISATIYDSQDVLNLPEERKDIWDDEDLKMFYRMVETGRNMEDWGVVDFEGERYYIEYSN